MLNNLFFNILSKIILFFSYGFIVEKCGSSVISDLYFYVLGFTGFLSGVFSVMSQAALPVIIIDLKSDSVKNTINNFAGSILGFGVAGILFISLVLFIFKIYFLEISNFPHTIVSENSLGINLMIISLIAIIVNEFYRVYLQSLGFFKKVALINFLQASINILLLYYLMVQESSYALIAVAFLFSLVVQLICFICVSFNENCAPKINLKFSNLTKRYFKIGIPLLPSHFITLFFAFYSDYLSLSLGEGLVTNLSIANRASQIPLLAIFFPIMEVLNIKLIHAYFRNPGLLKRIYNNILILQFIIFQFIVLFCILYNREIISLLFQKGDFKLDSVVITGKAFCFYCLSLITTTFIQLNNKIIIIYGKIRLSSILGSCGYLVMFFLVNFFIHKLNYLGIPIIKVIFDIFYFIPTIFLLFYVSRIKIFSNKIFKDLIAWSILIIISEMVVFGIYTKVFAVYSLNYYGYKFSMKLFTLFQLFIFSLATILCFAALIRWFDLFNYKKMALIYLKYFRMRTS